MERLDKCARKNKKEKHTIPINQELSEILAKYYDGSFDRLVQEYIRASGMSEEEREASVEVVRRTFTIKNVKEYMYIKEIIIFA